MGDSSFPPMAADAMPIHPAAREDATAIATGQAGGDHLNTLSAGEPLRLAAGLVLLLRPRRPGQLCQSFAAAMWVAPERSIR